MQILYKEGLAPLYIPRAGLCLEKNVSLDHSGRTVDVVMNQPPPRAPRIAPPPLLGVHDDVCLADHGGRYSCTI